MALRGRQTKRCLKGILSGAPFLPRGADVNLRWKLRWRKKNVRGICPGFTAETWRPRGIRGGPSRQGKCNVVCAGTALAPRTFFSPATWRKRRPGQWPRHTEKNTAASAEPRGRFCKSGNRRKSHFSPGRRHRQGLVLDFCHVSRGGRAKKTTWQNRFVLYQRRTTSFCAGKKKVCSITFAAYVVCAGTT